MMIGIHKQILTILFLSATFLRLPAQEIGLKVAPGATTPESVLLVWGEGDPLPAGKIYSIYRDDKLIDTTGRCFLKISGLSSDRLYQFHVALTDLKGKPSYKSKTISARTAIAGDTIRVTDFGAKGDSKTWSTRALQQAIDSCKQNGVVLVPRGIFLTGALFVKSNMTLFLEEGAILKAVHDIRAFPIVDGRFEGIEGRQYASLINGGDLYKKGIQNFSIRGKGVIDAEGSTLIKQEEGNRENLSQGDRGRIITINNGENIFFEGVRFLESPAWGVHFVYCHGVTLHNVYVNTNYDPETGARYEVHNGDGLALSSTKNTYVLGSEIISQDDNISIKSGRNQDGRIVGRSTDHVRVYNCSFSNGFGVVVGSEMSGNVRDVLVNNCNYINTAQLVELKCRYGRGGVIENVVFKNLTLYDTMHVDSKWFRGGICVDVYYGIEFEDQDYNVTYPVDESMPEIRDAWFENIRIHRTKGRGIYLCGRPDRFVRNMNFKNIEVTSPFPFEARFVRGITLDRVKVKVPENVRPYVWHEVEDLVQRN